MRSLRIASWAATAALFLLVVSLCLVRMTDTDLWWHIATGDLIRSTGEVPRADPFSYTAPGHPWIDIHWLYQIGVSILYKAGGIAALTVAKTLLVLMVFAVLYIRGRRVSDDASTVGVLVLAVMACQERLLTRPEVVSWLLLALFLAALDRALEAGSASTRRLLLWLALPAAVVVWVNVQALFILGPAMAALALLAAALRLTRRPVSALAWDHTTDLLVCVALLAIVSLLNPRGAMTVRLPFEQFLVHLGGTSLIAKTIAEFQPPLSGYLVTPSIVAFVVLAVLALVSLLVNWRRARPFEILVTAATLYLALRARRNIPVFVVAAVPILLRNASEAAGALRARIAGAAVKGTTLPPAPGIPLAPIAARAGLVLLCGALALGAVTNRYFLTTPTEIWWGVGTIPWTLPDDAALFVTESGIPGNVFHSLADGGYLIHAWKGRRPVFIDGRNDPYLDGVLETYLKAVADPALFEETVRRYQITIVLWTHGRALEGKALLGHLARSPAWSLAYLDPAAAVFVRRDVAVARRQTGGALLPGRDRREIYDDLVRRLEARPFDGPPIRSIALGEFFSVSGDPEAAEFFFRRALERLPGSAPVLHNLALSLERQGRTVQAREAHEAALHADPGFLPSVGALGRYLLDEGRLDEAEERIERAYRGGQRDVALLSARARLFDKRGATEKALAAYREAMQVSPGNATLLRQIASFYADRGDLENALQFLKTAMRAEPDDPRAAGDTALLLERMGRPAAALDAARAGAGRAAARLETIRAGRGSIAEDGEGNRWLLLLAARLERESGNPDRAKQWLKAASADDPGRGGDPAKPGR